MLKFDDFRRAILVDRRTFLTGIFGATTALCSQAKGQSRQFHMTYTNPVQFRLDQLTTATFAASTHAEHEVFWGKMEPNEWLRNIKETVRIDQDEMSLPLDSFQEKTWQKRPYWSLLIPQAKLKSRTQIRVLRTVEGDRYEPHIVDGKATTIATPDEKLIKQLTGIFSHCDYNEPAFDNWMKTASLARRPGESALDFAWRVYEWMRKNIRYDATLPYPKGALDVARHGYGECGRQFELYSTILRANNVPVKGYYGTHPSKQIKQLNTHVWGEFYAEGTGWVPIDSAGVCFGYHSHQCIPFQTTFDIVPYHVVSAIAGKEIDLNCAVRPIVLQRNMSNRDQPSFEHKDWARLNGK